MANWVKTAGAGVGAVGIIIAGAWIVDTYVWGQEPIIVDVTEQAVLTRADGSVEVLDPGMHFVDLARDGVDVYASAIEREHIVPGALVAEGCAGDVTVLYTVEDVLTFHAAGGDFAMIEGVDAEIAQFTGPMDVTFGEQTTQALGALRMHLRDVMDNGLRVTRLSVDFGDCAPVPPRIVLVPQALPPIATVGDLGAERAEIAALSLITADDVRVDVSGAVATYDIVEPPAFVACFGTGGPAADQMIAVSVGRGMRLGAGAHGVGDLATALTQTARGGNVESEFSRLREDCGALVGAVDFSTATFTRQTPVNCDDTPDAQACRP